MNGALPRSLKVPSTLFSEKNFRMLQNIWAQLYNAEDYHAALYIRLSKEDESEGPSESVNNQQSLLNEFVQQHHLTVFDTYIDDGWSGTNFVEVR